MRSKNFDCIISYLSRAVVVILFVAYYSLVILKSPFDFSDREYQALSSGQTQTQMVIENEPYDHFRTGAASLLLGLLLGNALLALESAERRRFAFAILGSSSVLIFSTFFGLSPLATQPILLVIGLYGMGVAAINLHANAKLKS